MQRYEKAAQVERGALSKSGLRHCKKSELYEGEWRNSKDSSVEIFDYPARNRKILRNFKIFLPKFHFILPKFYLPAPWKIFVCSLEILDFLGREEIRD